MVFFLTVYVERILRLFTIFYLHWFSTCVENSRYFWETIATERLEKVSLVLQKHYDSKAVALKEYYDYSPISTYTDSCRYFWETIVTVKLLIYRKQERDM